MEDFGDTFRTPSYTWNNKTSGEYCAGGLLQPECVNRINLRRDLSKIAIRGFFVGEIDFLGPIIPREGFTGKGASKIVQESRPLHLSDENTHRQARTLKLPIGER